MLQIEPLHSSFAARVHGVSLPHTRDAATLTAIRDAMDRYAVLVFPEQAFDDASQLAFAKRLDGAIHSRTAASVVTSNRFGNEALTDISNVGGEGAILGREDRRRLNGLANRLWHTDASFEQPAGRYSLLFAHRLPDIPPATEFADMRTAYDALPAATRQQIDGLRVHHSIVYSRSTLGFEFGPDEATRLPGAWHPLVRELPRQSRRSLYLASHAATIENWPVPEARLLLRDLIEHATQPRFVYAHAWRPHDLVIWDNRATMHRARPFDDLGQRRELRRVTTLDLEHTIT
ncbi:MAG: TauD/TfdA family dioxygenase [Burkholderiaceae bacterium]